MCKNGKALPALVLVLAMVTVLMAVPAAAAQTDAGMIGQTSYATLAQAVEDAKDGDVITLTADVVLDETLVIPEGKSLTIDGQGLYTVTGNAKKTFEVKAGTVFRNVGIVNTAAYGRCIDTRVGDIVLTMEGVNLEATGDGNSQPLTIGGSGSNITVNMTGCSIDAGTSGYGVITFNPVNMTIADSEISGYCALYFKAADHSLGSAGSVVNVSGSTLSSHNIHSGDSNGFGTIVFEDSNITVNVDSASELAATAEGDAPQYILGLNQNTGIQAEVADGATVKGELVSAADQANTSVKLPAVAKNETTGVPYCSLAEAVSEAKAGETVKLLKNIEGDKAVEISRNMILDGNGNSITVDGKYGLWVKGDASDVTIRNIAVTSRYYAVNVNSKVDLTIENAVLTGWSALYMFNDSTDSVVHVAGSVLNGINNYNEAAGTVVLQAENLTVIIDGNSTVNNVENGSGIQYALACNAYVRDANGNTVFDWDLWDRIVASYKTVFPASTDIQTLIDGGYCVHENPDLAGTVVVGEHKTLVEVKATDATCTQPGTVAHKECPNGCGTYYDMDGNAITSIVDDTKPAIGHKLVKVEAKAATAEAEGNIEYYVCGNCGKLYSDATMAKELSKTDVVIAKVPANGNPDTGDTHVVLPMVLLVLSVAGTALVCRKREMF